MPQYSPKLTHHSGELARNVTSNYHFLASPLYSGTVFVFVAQADGN